MNRQLFYSSLTALSIHNIPDGWVLRRIESYLTKEGYYMHIIETISEKGDGVVNEDAFGICDDRCWVIDGVTDKSDIKFFSDTSDANFIANSFSSILKTSATGKKTYTNRQLLAYSMDILKNGILKKEFSDAERIYQPSFTIAILNVLLDSIQIDILSDCYVIIKKATKILVLTDERIKCITQKTEELRKKITNSSIGQDYARKLLLKQKFENRKLMNQPNGYWVGTIDGVAFNNTISTEINKDDIEKVLVCSDGYFKIFLKNIITFDEIFMRKVTLHDSLPRLRNYERQDNVIDTKKSDDATAMLLEI